METLHVYADFDWLKSATLMGVLGHESLRGSDSYSFSFDKEWLLKYGSLFLGPDLNNYPGQQYTRPGRDIFGCFSDALPDRWGRTLLLRREQIQAREEHRSPRRLSSFDYLLGIDDCSRMGALRFKKERNGEYINSAESLRVPPLADIRTLTRASLEFEKTEASNQLPDKKWIGQLVHPGSSLGGARPKAVVLDASGKLCLIKFPSGKDDYDVALWEHHSHLLAKLSGVVSSDTSVLGVGEKYHALLSRRFDRTDSGRRIHFASAMTLLGLTDGCDAGSGNGYLDIVDFILQNCCDVRSNLNQLYRRVAFNIAIGNSDDHFRNHGFLLTRRGWTLAPAYDMNPSLTGCQSLLINSSSNESSLPLLLDSCGEYMLGSEDARKIIDEVAQGVAQWKALALRLGISSREMDMFAPLYEERLKSVK